MKVKANTYHVVGSAFSKTACCNLCTSGLLRSTDMPLACSIGALDRVEGGQTSRQVMGG